MQYVLTDTSAVRISESSGVIQNVGSYDIEISIDQNFEEVFVLRGGNEVAFKKRLYIRARDKPAYSIKVNVVTFIALGVGGGNSESSEPEPVEDDNVENYLDDLLNGGEDNYDNNSFVDIEELIDGVVPKITNPTAGNIPQIQSDGTLANSAVPLADVLQKVANPTQGHVLIVNSDGTIADSGYGIAADSDVATYLATQFAAGESGN